MSMTAERLYTLAEIADHFHVHVQTVRLWVRQNKIGHVPVGRYKYVSDDQLAAFIAARRIDVD